MTPTPLPSHAEPLPTLAQALVEIGALRARLEHLEHEVAAMRRARPGPAWDEPLAALDGHPAAAGAAASTPLAAVLAGDEETASQHLAHLRSAISRLRDERAHATAEFRSLTQTVRPGPPGADLGLERAEIAAAAETDLVMVDSATLEVVTSANEGPDEPWGFPASDRAVPTPVPAEAGELGGISSRPGRAAAAVAATPDPARDTVAELREKLQEKERSAARAASDLPGNVAAPARGRRRWPWLAAAVLLLAGAAGWWLVTSRRPASGSGASPSAAASVAAPRTSVPPAPASAGAPVGEPPAVRGGLSALAAAPVTGSTPVGSPGTTAPAPLVVALTTSREVWLRVLVDGVRSLERTVPGGETLRFEAQGAVQLVAGDAGAVRLEVNGAAQGPLGPDGQVARRRLDAPAPGSAAGLPRQ
jgi:hypothetical protein